MKKCRSWVPGNLSWRLGGTFWDQCSILMILVTFARKTISPFLAIFLYFLDAIFNAFSGTPLEGTFCKIWSQKHPKLKAFGGHFDDIFGDRRFLDFWYPYCTKPYILRSGGYPNGVIFGDVLEGALRKASGTWFLRILMDFGLPGGDHLAPKRHQKQGPKKVIETVILSSIG